MNDKVILTSGDVAPHFALPDANGKIVSLADFAGGKVIVYFYPAAMTPGCTVQAVDFTAEIAAFAAAGYAVVGISPDKQEKLDKFVARDGISFPLLSDVDKSTLMAYGAFGEKMMYGKLMTGVIRSTFLIDVDAAGVGTVREAQYNVRAKGHVDKLKRELGLPA